MRCNVIRPALVLQPNNAAFRRAANQLSASAFRKGKWVLLGESLRTDGRYRAAMQSK